MRQMIDLVVAVQKERPGIQSYDEGDGAPVRYYEACHGRVAVFA